MKTYNPSATQDDIIYNRCVGILTKNLEKWICFCGDGELHVTLSNPSASIKYSNTSQGSIIYNVTKTETITISPETHYYEPQSDGTYKITLILKNVQISNPTMSDTEAIFEYLPHRLPTMSRTVDFSKNIANSPEYDTSLISRINFNQLFYNRDIGHWSTLPQNYPYSEIYNNNIVGDFYFSIEDIGVTPPNLRLFNSSRGPNMFSGLKCETYDIPGLHRRYQDYKDTQNISMAHFDIVNAHLGGHVKYWHSGFTLPVNAVLYYGANGTNLHQYQWQSDSTGKLITYDSSVACQKVTKYACSKLKSDFGSNIRIYVIKYRKQPSYKHKISGSTINFDYSYIDSCASSSSYIYDVSTETDLKTKLNAIAVDIKNFAGYSSAKNILYPGK